MSLDEYAIALEYDKQKEMYKFMKESKKALASFSGKKLYMALEELFLNNENCVSLDSKKFTKNACIKWFQKKGHDYKNVGFEFTKNGEKYIFELATTYIYFGTGQRYSKTNRVNKKGNNDIFFIIEELKKIMIKL